MNSFPRTLAVALGIAIAQAASAAPQLPDFNY